MSGIERSQRHGELKKLREMKRDYHRAPKKRKILRPDIEGLQESDLDGEIDIKDIEFKLQHNKGQVKVRWFPFCYLN